RHRVLSCEPAERELPDERVEPSDERPEPLTCETVDGRAAPAPADPPCPPVITDASTGRRARRVNSGVVVTVSTPPIASILSRRPSRPRPDPVTSCCAPARYAGARPACGLLATSTMVLDASSKDSRRLTFWPGACLTAFVMASWTNRKIVVRSRAPHR